MTFEEGIKQTERAYNQITETHSMMTDAVFHAFLFTWQWWLGMALIIFPWFFWFMFRKKNSTGRLLFAGFTTIILSLMIDLIAISLGLWSYPVKFLPIAPQLFLPYHFSLAPVAIMVTLQIKPRANPLIKGIIFSAIAAFVGMNLFEMLGFYNSKGWPTYYDFIIFLFLFFMGYWINNMDSFKKLTEDAS
ncbi:CBO0543 family protein [Metabacillus sp. Hm71]|uniref:CBO0543 family protein n=1 Tax=Metabacillus sp. Hm71 TaxID=3450743 RepID=UPI003F42F8B7